MKAMILAAGLGTRLRPLTNDRPKALVQVGGRPLLEIAIQRLAAAGCTGIIVNVHHFADQVINFLQGAEQRYGVPVHISDERTRLLETGGGLKKARWFLDGNDSFLLCNADILSNMDLAAFYQAHCGSGALATLSVRRRQTSRFLIFDSERVLHGWTNVKTGELKMSRATRGQFDLWAFSGIHAIHPALFQLMPEKEAFSIIDLYLEAASQQRICAHPHDEDLWLDVGKPAALQQAEEVLSQIERAG
ncbi:MAG: nucleotidyltransferase family protein [Bacteroidota bacterium]